MTIFTVWDSAGLYEALANATGGDTIELDAGDYGSLELRNKTGLDFTYSAPVTITSADSNALASFSSMTMKQAENITFDNILFASNYSGDDVWSAPFIIESSNGITIRNSFFEGKLAVSDSEAYDGYATGKGLTIWGGAGFVIENNEFSTWHRAIVVGGAQNVVIKGNDIHSISGDGLNFASVNSVLIEDNYIHDFEVSESSGHHSDMIQFWTRGGTTPTTDVTIRGNILDIGTGDITQSIFMRNDMVDQGLAGEEMFYQNILIEENIILNGSSHGITVGETNGLVIRNNSVLSVGGEKHLITRINVATESKNVTIEKNAAASISGGADQPDWIMKDNAYIQNTDPNAPGYYADLFFESSVEARDSFWSYVVAQGSMIEKLSAGASRLLLDITPDIVTPHFEVTSSTNTPQMLVLDATHTYGPTGQIMPVDATFIWDFGDGKTATSRVVEHSYGTAGHYNVTLKVFLEGQNATTAATAYAVVNIAGDDVIAFHASDGSFYLQGYGTETAIIDSDKASVASSGGKAVDLGGTGSKIEIPKEAFSRLFGADTFEMSMTLQADQPNTSWGEVARIHGSMIISVQGDGNFNVVLFLDSGVVGLTTRGIAVNDGFAHDISIQLDGASNSLQILIDGVVAASETVAGSMPGMGSWGLAFGNPWGKQNFDGKLSAFDLNVVTMDYPTFDGVLDAPSTEPTAPEEPVTEEPVTEEPVTEEPATEPSTPEEPATGGNSDDATLPILDDYVANFAELSADKLHDDAYVSTTENGSSVHLDGERDYVDIGRLMQFEDSDQLSFSVTFNKNNLNDGEQHLVWNNKKVGLSVEGDSLKVYVGQVDKRFTKAIIIDDLGLDDTESHQVIVMIDASTDRLQVILDGVLVLDQQQDTNITFSEGKEKGWLFGSGRRHSFDGEIHDFRVDSSAEFLPENFMVPDDASVIV